MSPTSSPSAGALPRRPPCRSCTRRCTGSGARWQRACSGRPGTATSPRFPNSLHPTAHFPPWRSPTRRNRVPSTSPRLWQTAGGRRWYWPTTPMPTGSGWRCPKAGDGGGSPATRSGCCSPTSPWSARADPTAWWSPPWSRHRCWRRWPPTTAPPTPPPSPGSNGSATPPSTWRRRANASYSVSRRLSGSRWDRWFVTRTAWRRRCGSPIWPPSAPRPGRRCSIASPVCSCAMGCG